MEKDIYKLSDTNIFIISSVSLQSEFLRYVINREIGSICTIYEGDIKTFLDNFLNENRAYNPLILIDSESQGFEKKLHSISVSKNFCNAIVALYNLKVDPIIEKQALSKNIKGFFYRNDHIDNFLKGVRAILEGEIWIRRKVLLQYVYNSIDEKQSVIEEKTALTPREIEILSLLSMGYSNEEIADKMCISNNTVKTHLYHIFKKINVPNRLQAALWASQYL